MCLKRACLRKSKTHRFRSRLSGETSFRAFPRIAAAVVLLASTVWSGLAAVHPLDPLTPDEIRIASQVIKADRRFAASAIPFISVEEPPKASVLAWQTRAASNQAAESPSRHARALVVSEGGMVEAVVDIDAKRLLSSVERKGVQGPVTAAEAMSTSRIVLGNPQFQSSLRARGLTDFSKVFCAPFTAGYYAIPNQEDKRVLMAGCFDTRRATNNTFGWPIERLYAVDLRARDVLQVVDYGNIPISNSNQNFTESDIQSPRAQRKPTLQTQPEGANIQINGNEIRWGNWMLHVRVDPRVGPVISLARWLDGKVPRSVLYQGHLSEMFVPYMDPDVGWYSRTYFDAGEYGAGLMASPLQAGVDCPATSTFLPATFNNDRGEPFTTPRALCVFERDRGEPIWRHGSEGRRDVELVVRMAAGVGNYDYLLDWVFNDAAEIEVRVGATGIVALKGVQAQTMTDATAGQDTRYGTLVAPGLVATNHDHYFNFRLDLDVDGTENSFIHEVYEKVNLPAESPRRSLYVVRPEIPETEKAAQLDGGHGSEKFLVVNERKTNAVSNPTSYELVYANHARLMLDPADWPAKRARFLEHDLWVTAFNSSERFAAGEYVFASRQPDGLPVWTEKNRPIRRQDIVLWVNLGLHHMTRSEDQPVMPTVWHSFKLRPFNFADRNPALDLKNEGNR
jgi:primary-amine oxidase